MSLLHLSLRAATRIWEAAVLLVLTVYLVLGAGLLTLRYAVLPNAQTFRPWVEQVSSQALGLPVHIGAIQTQWHGLMPQFTLRDVRIDGPQGRPALQFAAVEAAPSWKSLTRLTPTFDQLVIRGADLTVTRPDADHLEIGGIRLALHDTGKSDAAQRFADWLFEQGEILILDSRLTWVNAAQQAPPPGRPKAGPAPSGGSVGAAEAWGPTSPPPLPLTQVNLLLRNTLLTHRAALTATPPAGFGGPIDLRASFRQPLFLRHTADFSRWSGTLYGEVTGVDLAALQPQIPLPLPVQTQTGRGSVRAWAQFSDGATTGFTADLALRGIALQLAPGETVGPLPPTLPPLALDTLSTRMTWAPLPGGESASLQNLQFRAAQGQSLPPVTIAWQWQQPKGGAAQARLQTGALDVGALSALAQCLPLPALWHERLVALQPHGRIASFTAQASWPKGVAPTGLPPAYQLQTRFADLGWNSPAGAGQTTPPANPRALIESGKAAAKALQLPAGLPGVSGLSGTVSATQQGGKAQIRLGRGGALDLPLVYAPARLGLDSLQADLDWTRDKAGQWQVSTRRLDFANADVAGKATLNWRSAAQGPGDIDLQGQFTRADARAVWRYLPIDIALHTRDYLRSAIAAGSARRVDFVVKGPLDDFPFKVPDKAGRYPGQFEVNAQIENGVFNYAPRDLLPPGQTASAASVHANAKWPELTQVQGELFITSHSLEVRNASARAYGARLSEVNGILPSFEKGVLSIGGKAQAPAGDVLRYLLDSPINQRLDGVFDGVQAQGPMALDIALELPLHDMKAATVKGQATLQGVDVLWSPGLPRFKQVRGTVNFTHGGFNLALNAPDVMGGAVSLRGGQQTGEPLQLQASGSFSSAGLRAAGPEWMQTLGKVSKGQAPYTLRITQPRGASEATLELRSNLTGAAIELPPPLGKPADATESLLYTRTPLPAGPDGARRYAVHIDLGGIARARYALEEPPPAPAGQHASAAEFRVLSGGIALGSQAALPQPASGVQANVRLPQLDLDAWDAAIKPLLPKASTQTPVVFRAGGDRGLMGLLPTTAALDIGRLTLMHRVIDQVVVGGSRSGDLLQANVNSRQMSGYIGWRIGSGKNPGALSARLARLDLPKSDDSDVENLLDEQPKSIPALDIVADNVQLHGHRFTHLEVRAVNRGQIDGSKAWQLTHFQLAGEGGVFTGSGAWTSVGAQLTAPGSPAAASPARRTSMQFKLAIQDAGKLLATLGKPGLLKGGKGEITGDLAWLGSPLGLDFPSLTGQFRLHLGQGQFLKADPGIAKLLGVLSLQSLPRRFTFDFRDLFSSGFAFDKVDADVGVNSGIASTRDFRMSGVAASVRIEGSANLAAETQDLRVVVIPNINAGAASLAYALINPVVGLGAFLAQYIASEPLARAFTHVYDITGTWVAPIVTEVALGAPKPAETPPATP